MIEKQTSSLASCVVWIPTTIQEAMAMKEELQSEACFVSGGTLLQIQWENGGGIPKHLISLEKIQEMQGITIEHNQDRKCLSIGALTALATCRSHPFIVKEAKLLSEAVTCIGAPAVRNRGTIGGNIGGRIGDLIPALLALDAAVTLRNDHASLTESLWDWLKNKDDQRVTLLTQIHLSNNETTNHSHSFYQKIGRREAFTAAIVTVAGNVSWNELGEWDDVRLVVGGGDNRPARLEATERLLTRVKKTEMNWKDVYETILEEFIAVTDPFVSALYRKKAAANMIISQLQV